MVSWQFPAQSLKAPHISIYTLDSSNHEKNMRQVAHWSKEDTKKCGEYLDLTHSFKLSSHEQASIHQPSTNPQMHEQEYLTCFQPLSWGGILSSMAVEKKIDTTRSTLT